MKIICDRKQLSKPLRPRRWWRHLVSPKPILQNVKLERPSKRFSSWRAIWSSVFA